MENLACSLFHNELVAGHCGHATRSLVLSLGDDGEIVEKIEFYRLSGESLESASTANVP